MHPTSEQRSRRPAPNKKALEAMAFEMKQQMRTIVQVTISSVA
jgi:hypothetical protein